MYTLLMKKIVLLTLVTLLGAAGLVYASPVCPMPMPMGIHPAMHCCQPDNCCRLENARPEVTAQSQAVRNDSIETSVGQPARTAQDLRAPKQVFSNSSSESPPEEKYYDLYSEYRI